MSEREPGPSSERRVVTVLFADVAGFTAMSEKLDPETVTEAMNTIFAALGVEVEAVGGHVDKVIGDSLMALFGAPVAHEDDAIRAVRAAIAMQRAMARHENTAGGLLGQPVRLRIGIHSGLVVWGIVGPPGHASPTVMGDVVNLASRLQSAAPEGGVLVSDVVYRQVRGTFACRALEPIAVKGKAEPVPVYEILGERERAEPMSRPPFVNRQDEMEQLGDLLARASRGRAQVAVVVGEPGVGKTRLVEEFTGRLAQDVLRLRTSCAPYGGVSLGPLADLFRQLGNLRDPVTMQDVEARITFGERATQAAAVLCRLFNLAEVPPGHEVPHDTGLLVASEAIRRMLTRPTVIWIEDLQWADAGTQELLPFVADRMADTPMLLIGTLRPDATPPAWGRRTALTTLQLGALSETHSREFLTAILGQPLPEQTARALVAKASGNPFYLNEIVATLRTAGTLILDDRGRWRTTGPVEDVLPDTVQGAVLARLDRLPTDLRALVHLASVIGVSFQGTLLADLSGHADVADALHALEDADLIRRRDPLAPDSAFDFTHPLVREVAYNSLLSRQRTVLHREIAQSVERLWPERGDDLAKTIGTHYARGAAPDRALPYLISAGEQAAGRYATREAIELLEEARRQAGEAGVPASCVQACELLGDLYLRVQDRGPKDRFDVWEYVRLHTDSRTDAMRWARATIRAAYALANDNRIADAWAHLEEAGPLIPPDDPLWSDFHRVRAYALIMESEYRSALEAARQSVAIANRAGTLEDRSRAYSVLSHPAILPLMGDEGRTVIQGWVSEAAATGDERLLIEARHFLVSDVWTRGLVDADLIHTGEEALRRAEDHGWTRDEATFRLFLGWARFLTGAWPEAQIHFSRAHDLVQMQGGRMQAFILLPLFRANLAMGAGRLDEARQILEDALVHARFHAPIWLNHDLARCHLMLGNPDAARAAMARALEARDLLRCVICGCQANGIAAEFYAGIAEPTAALALVEEVDAVARDIGHRATQIRVARTRARVALHGGRWDEATAEAQAAVVLGAGMPLLQPLEHAQSLALLGEAYRAAGAAPRAHAVLLEARALLEKLGAPWYLQQVDRLLSRVGAG